MSVIQADASREELEAKLTELMIAHRKWTPDYAAVISGLDDDLLRHLIRHYGGFGGPFVSH